MKTYVLLKHLSAAPRYRTGSLADLTERLEVMKSAGDDLEGFIVIEIDAEDLKNSPPLCKTAGDFLRSARVKP